MENKSSNKKVKETTPKTTEKVEEKNQILAKRATVKMWQPIVGHIILIIVATFLALIIALTAKKDSDMVSYILMFVVVGLLGLLVCYLIVSMILDIIKVSKYNKENELYVEYKAGIFTLHMQNGNLQKVKREDIVSVNYKANNGLFFSPHYIYEQTYKLGKLIFVLEGNENNKIVLRLMPDAKKVYEKITKILNKKAEK